ncbi:MAG: 30S ribosomal protein S7 [archaeon]|jgi:small subunit ribosomal protein S7
MEQNIESKVEAPVAVHAPHAAQAKEAKAPVANAKVVKKDFAPKTAEVPTAPVAESKPIIVRKKSQFSDYKLFNKWSFADVIISDLSLNNYVNLDPVIMPHTFGRKTRGRFEKANLNIVERLVNKIMRSGQGKRKLSGKFIRGRGSCGKKMEAMKIVESAFEIIEKQTKQNPIQVYIKAIENSAPREDVTRVKKGGVAYTLAVDVSPLKRLDEAVKNLALGGFGGSFNKKVSAQQALADEIIAAAANDIKSSSVKRKDEVERIAKASR